MPRRLTSRVFPHPLLTLMLTANVPFEAVAIDNIRINGVPEPSASLMSVLGILGVMMARRRGKE